MIILSLQAIPNQQFTVQLDRRYYDITLNTTGAIMAATIIRDNVTLVTGARVVAGFVIIPYRYLESGNFIISASRGELPDYKKFGVTQNLIYFSQEEIDRVRSLV